MLKEFVADRATAAEWAAFHALRRAEHDERYPEQPQQPDEGAEIEVRQPDSNHVVHRFLEWDGERAVGSMRLWSPRPGAPEYDTNSHLMDAYLWVLPSCRRRGIARSWLPTVLDLMNGTGTSVLTLWTKREDAHAFLRWLGAEPKRTERLSRLDLEAVDWSLVRRWVEEGERRSPGSTLVYYPHRLPVEALSEVTAATTKLIEGIPWEGQDQGALIETPEQTLERYARLDATGGGHDTVLVRDTDGSIVALTDVYTAAHEPEFVDQGFTAVRLDAQGRGLGKWVKAAMLERIRQRHPRARWITTGNAQSNEPMLAINSGLGFRLQDVTVVYQIGRDALAARIG